MLPALAMGLTLGLLPQTSAAAPRSIADRISIDDCVDADRGEIVRLLEVELGALQSDAGAAGGDFSLRITCSDQPGMVQVVEQRGTATSTRLLNLSGLDAAARKARARELVLVIAELMRGGTEPPRAKPRPTPPAPKPAPPPKPERRWLELSLLGSAEKYSGGYSQLGLVGGIRWLPVGPLLLDARLGAHLAPTLHAAAGDVQARSGTLAFGVGLDLLPGEHAAGLALLSLLEGQWVFVEGHSHLPTSAGQSSNGWAWVLSVGPSAWLALGKRVRIVAEPALLLPIQSLSIEDRGRDVSRISDWGAAANLGVSFWP